MAARSKITLLTGFALAGLLSGCSVKEADNSRTEAARIFPRADRPVSSVGGTEQPLSNPASAKQVSSVIFERAAILA